MGTETNPNRLRRLSYCRLDIDAVKYTKKGDNSTNIYISLCMFTVNEIYVL